MKSSNISLRGYVIIIVLFVILAFVAYFLFPQSWNQNSCADECKHRGFKSGNCLWPSEASEDYKNIGGCLIPQSKHCGNIGQCNCYCFYEAIVGGCAGVAPEHIQKCCERWADENNIVKPACVGYWEVREGRCGWVCGAANDSKKACLMNGGLWVDISNIENYEIDLGISTTEKCLKYVGSCSEMRIISSTTIGKCDDGNDCWIQDFLEDTCLLPE